MGLRGVVSSLAVLAASVYLYSAIFSDPEESLDSYRDPSMNIAKKIAANVIKAAPSGPVSEA